MPLKTDAARANMMLVAAFAAVIVIAALMVLGHVPGGSAVEGFLMTIGGLFARNIGTAFDFEYGSSRSSQTKDATIASLKAQ